jgi:hypothetical protein
MRFPSLVLACVLAGAAPPHLGAQRPARAAAKPTGLVGTWAGTATVQLGDSTLTVPVTYAFTQMGDITGGMAMVPGQGSGPISQLVRDGAKVRFRVTAPENRLLEHDGTVSADSTIQGMVYLDKQPVAQFKIRPAKAGKP